MRCGHRYHEPIGSIRIRPDRRRFPWLRRGSCFNCGRRNRVDGAVTCIQCRDILSSPLMGHLPGLKGGQKRERGQMKFEPQYALFLLRLQQINP